MKKCDEICKYFRENDEKTSWNGNWIEFFMISNLPILGLEIDFLEDVFFLFQLRLIDDPLVLLEFLGLRL